jgi:hypothetical protein
MSFLEELKKDYEEVSILTEDIKDDIKWKIKEAVSKGSGFATITLTSNSELLSKNAIKYVKEELGLEVFRECLGVSFRVKGWS